MSWSLPIPALFGTRHCSAIKQMLQQFNSISGSCFPYFNIITSKIIVSVFIDMGPKHLQFINTGWCLISLIVCQIKYAGRCQKLCFSKDHACRSICIEEHSMCTEVGLRHLTILGFSSFSVLSLLDFFSCLQYRLPETFFSFSPLVHKMAMRWSFLLFYQISYNFLRTSVFKIEGILVVKKLCISVHLLKCTLFVSVHVHNFQLCMST